MQFIQSTGIGRNELYGSSTTPKEADRLTLTVPEVARLLGISRGAAYAAAAERTIPTIRIGRRLLVPREALARLLRLESDYIASLSGEAA